MDKGPWKITERTQIYKNPWMTIVEDKVIQPDGKQGIYGTADIKAGAAVIPIDEEGNIYLIDEFRYAIGKRTIKAAGGAVEKNEPPLNAAKRELQEELGLEAREWIDLGHAEPITSMINSPQYMFLARKLTKTETNHDSTEVIKTIKMPLSEAVEKVMKGEIIDAIACILILKTKEYLKK